MFYQLLKIHQAGRIKYLVPCSVDQRQESVMLKAVDAGIPVTNSPRFKLHQMSDMQKAGKLNCKVPLDFGISI